MVENSVVSRIFAVFTELIEWITTSIGSVSEMFYNETSGLTTIGTLAVIGLGISVVFLLINVIKSMLRLR